MRFQSGSALQRTVGSFVSVGAGATVNRLSSHLVYVVTVGRALGLVVAHRFLILILTID